MKYLIILLVLLSSCSLEKRLAKYCPLCVQKDSTVTVIQIKDTTIVIPGETITLIDTLYCDSLGNVISKLKEELESVNEEIKVGSSVTVNYPTLKKPIKGKVAHILKSPTGLVYVLAGGRGVWDAKNVSLKESVDESVNEAKTYTPKQVKQALEQMVKQLKAKWKQKGGYENFGQRELDKFKKTFGYSPYGSSEERKISDLIDSFEDWAMDYSG